MSRRTRWLVGGVGVAALAVLVIVQAGGEVSAPREPEATGEGARARPTSDTAATTHASRRITARPAAPLARPSLDSDAWFDARAAGFERAQRDALEAVALDDAELEVLLAAAAKEQAGAARVAAAAVESIRAGAAPPERLDLSGVEQPLEALLGDRYPTYVLIRLSATVEEFDAIDGRCDSGDCQ